MLDRIAKALFALGLAVLLVLLGVAIGWYGWWPAPQIDESVDALQDWRLNWRSYAANVVVCLQ